MKTKILPLFLCLILLIGCSSEPKETSTPTKTPYEQYLAIKKSESERESLQKEFSNALESLHNEPLNSSVSSATSDNKKISYYIGNKSTKKYHKPSCDYLPSPENRVNIPENKIQNYSEYTPCGHCKP